jgi:general secretion pathway protein D
MLTRLARLKRLHAVVAWAMLLNFLPATVVWAQPLPPGISGGAPIFPAGMPPGGGLTPPPQPGLTPPSPVPPDAGGGVAQPPQGGNEKLILLNFRDSPLDQVLEFVADLMGRTMIKSPGINATITLKSQTRLTVPEALQAIEAVLAMNNVTLVPMGEKFLKVVQTGQARMEGMPFSLQPPEGLNEEDKLISQVITLKYMEIAEVQPIIQSLIHGYGKIQPLERTNSMLITDTASNLKRILEILEYIDQPTESKIETRIYEIHYAEASQVASKLNELIADSQAKEDKPRVEQQPAAVQQPAIPTPPGVIRARPPGMISAADAGSSSEVETALQLAERGVIRGKVKIIADDRTNILFVLSRVENFAFFDKIVAVLDRPVEPEITVRVVALEYAKAEEIAGILNEFIGAATADQTKTPAGAAPADGAGGGDQAAADAARSQSIRDFIQQRAQRPSGEQGEDAEGGGLGRLSSNTKILADKRSNSLLLMGKMSDLDALEEVINSLDTMLAQVLIETVIIEVNLGKNIQYGVDWLQRSVIAYDEQVKGPGQGMTVRDPLYAFAGGSSQGGDPDRFQDASQITDRDNLPLSAGALTYYLTFFDLNLDAVLNLAANSRDARILSTPVILTTDNTEAKINVGEQRPIVTSTSTTDTGTQTQNFEYKNIGIQLTVTPRINPQRFVVLEIAQQADNVNGFETINGNRVPIITKREMQAQIAVRSRSSIALGGLVLTNKEKTRAKVPFLGDLPLLGMFFRSDAQGEARTELLVVITPYVLTTPEEARAETMRLHNNSFSSRTKWHKGWSDSPLSRQSKDVDATPAEVEAPLPPKTRTIFSDRDREEFKNRPETTSQSLDQWQDVTVPEGTVRKPADDVETAPGRLSPPVNVDVNMPGAGQQQPVADNVDVMVIPDTEDAEPIMIETPAVPETPVAPEAMTPADDPNAPVPMN